MQTNSALSVSLLLAPTPDDDDAFADDLVALLHAYTIHLTLSCAQVVVLQPYAMDFVEAVQFENLSKLGGTTDFDGYYTAPAALIWLHSALAASTILHSALVSSRALSLIHADACRPIDLPHITSQAAALNGPFSPLALHLMPLALAHTPRCGLCNTLLELPGTCGTSLIAHLPHTCSPVWTGVRSFFMSFGLSQPPDPGIPSLPTVISTLRLRGSGDCFLTAPLLLPGQARPRDDDTLPHVGPDPNPDLGGSLREHLALSADSMGATAAAVGTDPTLACAHLHFHDGSTLVLLPGTSRFILGKCSLPFLAHLPSECRRRIEPSHISLSFHDDILVASALCQSSGLGWGPHVLRASGERVPLPRTPHPLGSGDTLLLAYYLGHAIAPVTFSFTRGQAPAPAPSDLSLRLDLAERALRVSEVERTSLQRDVEELREALIHTDSTLATNLARTTDALERRRVRVDGVFCSCCAMLRLPDFFFPSILAAGTPPANRRCALCIQHIRTHHDLFGRPFFAPSGYSLPEAHRDDLRRLAELTRCVSCARMRHSSLFRPPNSYDSSLPRPLAYDCLVPCTLRLTKPIPRNAPRSPTFQPVCTFCRHELPKPPPPASAPAASRALPLDARDTTHWEPHPDKPGDGDDSDCDDYYHDYPEDPPDDSFCFDDLRHAL